jgi:hypothetical protein
MGGFSGFMSSLSGGGTNSFRSREDARAKSTPSKEDSSEKPSYGGTNTTGQNYKRGGKVRKTGLAKVHAGERVLTKKQAKRYRKQMGGK